MRSTALYPNDAALRTANSSRRKRQVGDQPQKLRFHRTALSNLSPSDQDLFEAFGQGPVCAPRFPLIHRAFEFWAARRPDAVAAEHLGQTITYGELERQATRLALRLQALGVRPGDNVALFLRRSIPMLVGILASLKVGAAYVPQDARLAPEVQLRHIVSVAKTRVILTLSEFEDAIPVAEGHQVIAIDRLRAETADADAGLGLSRALRPEDTCFVLFTSGTTGTPNGVQVTHRNVCNILLTPPGDLGIRPGLKVAQILCIAFDMAAWEILGALANGATLVIRGSDVTDAAARSDVVIATPSILGSMDIERCRNVKVAAVAGEPCPRPLADAWSSFATFYNACGPTETTIVNTAQRYDRSCASLTIGAPTPNNTVYVLDQGLRPCRIGEVGEMWAGGCGVSKGYLDNDALNAERYLPDPFIGGSARMFRTRDLGRWTPEGELEHLGRTDDQVKVRGFRVELDGISSVLETAAGCMKAVTLKLDERTLVSFVSPGSVDTRDAMARVAAALPYYCVPACVIVREALPLTGRGKVDKALLMAEAAAHAGTAIGRTVGT